MQTLNVPGGKADMSSRADGVSIVIRVLSQLFPTANSSLCKMIRRDFSAYTLGHCLHAAKFGLDLEAGKPLGHSANIPERDERSEYFPFGQVRQLSAPLGLENQRGSLYISMTAAYFPRQAGSPCRGVAKGRPRRNFDKTVVPTAMLFGGCGSSFAVLRILVPASRAVLTCFRNAVSVLAENLPGGQSLQPASASIPMAEEYVPVGQSLHVDSSLALEALLHLPMPHNVHSVLSSWRICPRRGAAIVPGHRAHLAARQALHTRFPTDLTFALPARTLQSMTTAAPRWWGFPLSQFVQLACLDSALNVSVCIPRSRRLNHFPCLPKTFPAGNRCNPPLYQFP